MVGAAVTPLFTHFPSYPMLNIKHSHGTKLTDQLNYHGTTQ